MENNENRELKMSSANKRAKKQDRREAKAARKEANRREDKKSRPNNVILGIMIIGIVAAMFAFAGLYKYFSKDATIEKYIENNKESFKSITIDQLTTARITAKGNSMKIVMDSKLDEKMAKEMKEFYKGNSGEDRLKYLGAYFLTSVKPNVRGSSADVTTTINLNGEELNSVSMTYKEAKDYLEELQKKAEKAKEDEAETGIESDDSDEDSDKAKETPEEAAGDK